MKRKNIFKILTTSAISACMLCAGLFPIVKAPVNAVKLGDISTGTSYFTNYQTLTVGTTSPGGALFGTGGMNDTVAGTLGTIAQAALTNAGDGTATAADFSTYVKEANNDDSKEGGVLVKLFDTVGSSNVQAFTQQWWQPVYCDGQVLTLYMAEPYRTTMFNPSSTSTADDKGTTNYPYNNTYEGSMVKANLGYDITAVLAKFSNANDAILSPSELTGTWQRDGYDVINDSKNEAFNSADKIWLPSAYETLWKTDSESPEYVTNFTTPGTATYSDSGTRTGLWEMNAFDRAFSNSVSYDAWLRSGYSHYSDHAFAVNYFGNDFFSSVLDTVGLRPALHLNLSSLGGEEPTPTAPSASVGFAGGSAGAARFIAPANGGTPATGDTVSFDHFPYQIKFDASQGHTISTITIGGTTIAIAASQGEAGSGTEILNYCTYKAWYDSVKRVVILQLTQVTATGSFNIIASTAVEKGLTDYNGSWWLLGYYS